MAYQATIVPVMIASPGDVTEERDIIREVIHDWNDVNAANSKIMLAPMGWETHSSPELGTRPQELINNRILKDCDLLVGVFWTRLGTPTGKSKSGTVEEIENHVKAGKPAMIYFSSKPVAPASLDDNQYSEVKSFKEKCREWGLVEEFENVEQFRSKISKQLQICLAQNTYLKSVIKPMDIQTIKINYQKDLSQKRLEISEDAKTLLKSASKTDGTILKQKSLGGRMSIFAGGQSFISKIGRETAKWEGVIDELITLGLIVGQGYKGEFYELTHLGWEVADKL